MLAAMPDAAMTPDEFRDAGERLFGARWQLALARALGVDGRTVRRWLAGERKVDRQTCRHIGLLERLQAAGELEAYLESLKSD